MFNLYWLFEFGNKIERFQSGFRLLVLVLVTGIVANVCQFLHQPQSMFGGLSGVVYGLFAYCILQSRLYRAYMLKPRPGVEPFLLVWLLIGVTGIMSTLGIVNIANAAHIGGLMTGILMGLIPFRKSMR